MPKLPNPQELERRTPRPSQNIVSYRPGVIAEATGEFGRAMHQIGSEAFDYLEREKVRLDDVAIEDAKNKYAEERLLLETEYRQIQGRHAVNQDIVKDYNEKLNTINADISINLKNSDQQKAWSKFYNRDRIKFNAGVLGHKLQESDQYAGQVYKSTINTATKIGHTNWADEKAVNENAVRITERTIKEADRIGASKAELEEMMISNLGPYWEGIVAQHISVKDYDGAETLLKQHKEVIGTGNKIKYSKFIQDKKALDKVEIDVGNFWLKNSFEDTSNKTIREHFSNKYKGRPVLQKRAIIEATALKTAATQEQTGIEQKALQDIAGQFLDGSVTYESILASDMTNTNKVTATSALDTKRTKGPKYISDLAIRASLKMRANTDPTNLTDDEIWNVVYQKKGITDIEAQAIQLRRDDNIKALQTPGTKTKQDSLKRAHGILTASAKERALDDNPDKNLVMWANVHEDLDDYMEANPDADPIDYVEEKIVKPIEESWVIRFLKFQSPGYRIYKTYIDEEITPEGKKSASDFAKQITAPKVKMATDKLIILEDDREFEIVDGIVTIDNKSYRVK